jgi:hypothetical protein
MRTSSRVWALLILTFSLGLGGRAARAGIDTSVPSIPPDGWTNVCAGHSITVKPTLVSHIYTGTGSCWVNTAQNKSDGTQQNWVRSAVTMEGSYATKSSSFAERLTFPLPSGTAIVTATGSCSDDPWATAAQCGATAVNVNVMNSFGWALQIPNGPLSRSLFGAALVSAMLQKQASSPPLAPVDLEAVRWPSFDGSGTLGRVFWRAPDVSGNRWILGYDIEYALNSSDSAFSNAGHIVGPGAKTTLSPSDIARYFYTTFKLGGGDYYFRVCSANDAGRACSLPVKARQPTTAELAVVAQHHTQVKIAMPAGGSPPTAPPRVAAPQEVIAGPAARTRLVTPVPTAGH